MKPIYLDCDGVLLDWEAAFRVWISCRIPHKITDRPQNWDLSYWLGVSKARAMAWIHEFNHSKDFCKLAPLPGAQEFVKTWHECGSRIEVLTSCSRDPAVVERRKKNLSRVFGEDVFSAVECLDLGESKAPSLMYRRKGIWIEDNYHGAVAGMNLGHKTFMVRCPHNQQWEADSDRRITWVNRISDVSLQPLSLFV